ncbi:hypothetical protein DVH05_001462 [Phytophthora capsici]|nr:hypothetical protein DVH05_001462 [Phytophthora capsici]
MGCPPGSPATAGLTPTSSSDSHYFDGRPPRTPVETSPTPFCPRSVISAVFVVASVASPSASTKDTNWLCKGCITVTPTSTQATIQSRAPPDPTITLQLRLRSGRVHWVAAFMGFLFVLRRSAYLADRGKAKDDDEPLAHEYPSDGFPDEEMHNNVGAADMVL